MFIISENYQWILLEFPLKHLGLSLSALFFLAPELNSRFQHTLYTYNTHKNGYFTLSFQKMDKLVAGIG